MRLSQAAVRRQLEILIQQIEVERGVEKQHARGRAVRVLADDQLATTVRIANHLADVIIPVELPRPRRLAVDYRYRVVVVLLPARAEFFSLPVYARITTRSFILRYDARTRKKQKKRPKRTAVIGAKEGEKKRSI